MRRRWTIAISLSMVAHAAVVLALTPREPAPDEAGSGAGSRIEGSVDAMIGIDMPIETLDRPEPTEAIDTAATEVSDSVAAEQVAMAEAEDVPTVATTAMQPIQADSAMQAPIELAELSASEATAANAAASEELAVATPLGATESAPIEADLAAAPTEAVAAASVPDAQVVETAEAIEAVPAPETLEVAAMAPAVQAAAAETLDTVPPREEAKRAPLEPQRRIPPPTKPSPREVKAAPAKPRGNSEVASRRGAETADADSQSRDPGFGRSREAGSGSALASRYSGQVAAKLRRARRHPGSSVQGTAQVAFSIGSGGAVSALRLVASSGSPLLDQAALDTVRRAAPFPPPPVPGFAIRVPIRFGLRL